MRLGKASLAARNLTAYSADREHQPAEVMAGFRLMRVTEVPALGVGAVLGAVISLPIRPIGWFAPFHARLRENEEGLGVENFSEVFL